MKVDIAGLQEPLDYQVSGLAELLGDSFGNTSVGRDDGVHKGEHVAIFYNKKKFKVCFLQFFLQTAIGRREILVEFFSGDSRKQELGYWLSSCYSVGEV